MNSSFDAGPNGPASLPILQGMAHSEVESIIIDDSRLGDPLAMNTADVPFMETGEAAGLSDADEGPPASLIRLDEVELEEIEWVWPRRVPLGKLTIISGDPGLGKSFVTLDMAARVSAGRPWPDMPDLPNEVGSVILLSAEDGLADTIKPRLIAAGADASRIRALDTVRGPDGNPSPFDLKRDIPKLEWAIKQTGGVRLIIIDPITAYCGGADDHKNGVVRGLLQPLADLAKRYGLAVVVVSHLNKSVGGKAAYRTTGSLAYTAAARVAWMFVKDPHDPDRRLMLPIKNNLASDKSGLAYRIDDGKVEWEAESVDMTADEALMAEAKPKEKPSKVGDAAEFLQDALANGPRPSLEVLALGRETGLSERTLKRAKEKMAIFSIKGGANEGGQWYWSFDRTMPAPPERDHASGMGHLGIHGPLDPGDDVPEETFFATAVSAP